MSIVIQASGTALDAMHGGRVSSGDGLAREHNVLAREYNVELRANSPSSECDELDTPTATCCSFAQFPLFATDYCNVPVTHVGRGDEL